MNSFSILLLLLAALTAVIAIPNPHAFGLLACGGAHKFTFVAWVHTDSDR
jgi:hypothetical protein